MVAEDTLRNTQDMLSRDLLSEADYPTTEETRLVPGCAGNELKGQTILTNDLSLPPIRVEQLFLKAKGTLDIRADSFQVA